LENGKIRGLPLAFVRTALMGDRRELGNFGVAEKQAARFGGALGSGGFGLTREHAIFVAMAKDVPDHGGEVLRDRTSCGKVVGADRFRMGDLKVERRGRLLSGWSSWAIPDRRE